MKTNQRYLRGLYPFRSSRLAITFLVALGGLCLISLSSCRRPPRVAPSPSGDSNKTAVVSSEMETPPWGALWRTPRAGRTFVFPRSQVKYGLYQNYNRRWLDRPLLHDSSLRDYIETKTHAMKYPSYARNIEIIRSYDVDGLAQIIAGNMGYGLPAFEFADQAGVPEFHVLPEFAGNSEQDKTMQDTVLKMALASRSAMRLNGKLLITSYGADSVSPEEWKAMMAVLRAKHGDVFIFLPQITAPGGFAPFVEIFNRNNGALPDADREQLKNYYAGYMQACDGIYVNHAPAEPGPNGPANRICAEFFRKVVIPVVKELYSTPEARDKYLGGCAYLGHFSVGIGANNDEDGTKRLRQSFEMAMELSPDVIVLPEWDEVNENTCIQPTVCNSFSTQRILKYYMSLIKGIPPVPNPGDDRSLPNLIVSFRKQIMLGEILYVELLNVPDSDESSSYSVELALKDETGRIVKEFAPQRFQGNRLEDHTLAVPAESFAGHVALIPSLTIINADGSKRTFEAGLHHIGLRATWNWDFKWIHHPLRDVLVPARASVQWADNKDAEPGWRDIAVVFDGAEQIAQAEILENDDVVYAVDPENEYFRDDPDKVLFLLEIRSLLRKQPFKGTVTIQDAESARWLRDAFLLHNRLPDPEIAGDTLTIRQYKNISGWITSYFFVMSRRDAEKAALVFDTNVIQSDISLKQIMDNGIYSESHKDGLTVTGLTVTVSRFYKQPDIPRHLNCSSVAFTAQVKPELATSVFHLRVVAKSGRIYRSPPLLLPGATEGERKLIHVYSSTAKAPIELEVPGVQVPDIRYDFTPRYGTILRTAAGRPFWGHLGGNADASTGRGGEEGGNGGYPFYGGRNYPTNASKTT
ncbi:MAG: hypothetical protein Q7J98_02035, partial [Kiritimatiellia bacterium]|nr:hypothetical protein [Kiritimatiellia bacterium]